jgi:hypothetical protein
MKVNKNIIIGLLAVLIFLLGTLVNCNPEQAPASPKATVKKMADKVQDLKKDLDPVSKDIETQKKDLIKWKIIRDTVEIIRVQDSIIYRQGEKILILDTIVVIQDSIIYIQGNDNKALKKSLRRQKIKTIGVGIIGALGIVGAVLISK